MRKSYNVNVNLYKTNIDSLKYLDGNKIYFGTSSANPRPGWTEANLIERSRLIIYKRRKLLPVFSPSSLFQYPFMTPVLSFSDSKCRKCSRLNGELVILYRHKKYLLLCRWLQVPLLHYAFKWSNFFENKQTHRIRKAAITLGKCLEGTTISTGRPYTSRESCKNDFPVAAIFFTDSSVNSDSLNSCRHFW